MRDVLRRTLGWLAMPPYAAVVVLVLLGPATWSGLLYIVGLGVIVVGLAMRRRPHGIARWGLATLAVVATIRCGSAAKGTCLRMGTPSDDTPRIVNRLIDEADVAVAGTRVLTATRLLRDDAHELTKAMEAAYARMREEQGDVPSPVVATYLGLQDAGAFDLLVFDPPAAKEGPAPTAAMVFLHGFAGGFSLPCWQIARAVAPSGMVTACPSTSWRGDWWSPTGEAIVRRTVEILRARGVRSIVLAGLSNGGIGASRLAPRMRGTFAALVLVSGVAGDAPPAGVPTLVVHGTRDTMTSFGEARAYATRSSARLVTLDAGHFAMLVCAEQHDRAVRELARQVVARSAAAPAARR